MVGSESMSVSIRIVNKSSLKHLAVGGLNTWHKVCWGESGLFSLSVEILWISVESKSSNLDEGNLRLWPNLGDIIYVETIFLSLIKWHRLDIPCPRWEVALLNVLE